MGVALLLVTLFAVDASSTGNEAVDCDGDLTIVRISRIKPEGSLDGFMQAVEAQRAWYRANGVNDNEIIAAPVILRDESTGAMSYSQDQVITLHVRPPFGRSLPARGDADYEAFEKLYRDNSEIASSVVACVPKSQRISPWFRGDKSKYWDRKPTLPDAPGYTPPPTLSRRSRD